MTKKIAIQMDPIAHIDITGDTTFALALEAQARGYELYYYEPDQLFMRDGDIFAQLRPLRVADMVGAHFELGDAHVTPLLEMDVVLLRQDPPYDMHYLSTTYLLERIHPHCLVVNDPKSVRDMPEKLFSTAYKGLMPPTLISRDRGSLQEFRAEFGDVIIKPLYGNGGAGIFRIKSDDENFAALLDMFLAQREPVIAQKYLPEIRQGDKRIILVEGEAVGALNRIPKQGDARANIHVGGTTQAATLTDRDKDIVAAIGADLKHAGIIFAGIDVIGDYLTEVNVTSPTCVREIKDFGGADIASLIWDAIDARMS